MYMYNYIYLLVYNIQTKHHAIPCGCNIVGGYRLEVNFYHTDIIEYHRNNNCSWINSSPYSRWPVS